MQDLAVPGGGHTFATGAGSGTWQQTSRLEGLATTVGDKGSVKHVHQVTVGSLGLGDPTTATKLTVYLRADPAPASSAWGTGSNVVSGPSFDLTPETTSGHSLEGRVDFFSPSGAAVPPKPAILDALRTTYWRTAPDLETWTFDAEYGDAVVGLGSGPWPAQGRSVEDTTAQLIAMAQGGRMVMRDRQDQRWSVKVKHLLERETRMTEGPFGKTVKVRITVAILGDA
jgi:hypothetical protein